VIVNQCAIHIEPAGNCYRVFLTDWAGFQLGYTPEHMHPTLVASEHKARAIGSDMAQAAGLEVVAYLIGQYAPNRERSQRYNANILVGVWTDQEIFDSKTRSNAWIQRAREVWEEMLPIS